MIVKLVKVWIFVYFYSEPLGFVSALDQAREASSIAPAGAARRRRRTALIVKESAQPVPQEVYGDGRLPQEVHGDVKQLKRSREVNGKVKTIKHKLDAVDKDLNKIHAPQQDRQVVEADVEKVKTEMAQLIDDLAHLRKEQYKAVMKDDSHLNETADLGPSGSRSQDDDGDNEKEKEKDPPKSHKKHPRVKTLRHRLVEVGIGLMLMVLLYVAVHNFRAGRQASMNNNRVLVRLAAEATTIHGSHLSFDSCDLVMVFPLRGRDAQTGELKTKETRWSATRTITLDWDQAINGLEMARGIFQDPSKPHLVSNDILVKHFATVMTVEMYHAAVCLLLMELLAGKNFGLRMEAFQSIDNDEVFLKVYLPRDNVALHMYAADFSYMVPLNDVPYQEAGIAVPEDAQHKNIRARAQFLPSHAHLFMEFSRTDVTRLLRARINKFIDIDELMSQNILCEIFPAHDWEDVSDLCQDWGNLRKWYHLPDHRYEDKICAYFGEEVGWLFVWQACFTRALVFPACLGALVFFRRYVGLPLMGERLVALAYTLIMVFWATIFNAWFKRYEAAVCVRWGMDKFRPPISKRNAYDPSLEGSYKVVLAHVIGDLCAMLMISVVVAGCYGVQQWRQYLITNHGGPLALKVALLTQTLLILIIDQIWVTVSRVIVNWENHSMQKQWNHSWVHKVFLVRIFNNLYPFLYLGFLKQFTQEGCPDTEGGCLDELETNLFMYFLIRIVIDVSSELYWAITMHLQIMSELHKKESAHKNYTYLQVQAKCAEYDDWAALNDWTDLLMTFVFLACFNVVLPSMAPIAFINSLFQARCWAYRNLRLLRRPFPVGANGIGPWQGLFESAEAVAVIVNTAFAVFAMKPIKDFGPISKFAIFVAGQWLIHVVKFLIHVKVPSVSNDVLNCQHTNKDVVIKRFIGIDEKPIEAPVVKQVVPTVGPQAFADSQ